MATVLLLESVRANGLSFAPHLKKRYEVLIANTGKEALSIARSQNLDVVIVDSASLRTSGERICAAIRNERKRLPIINIKQGPPKSEELTTPAEVLYLPFTYRKLVNRIERYTSAHQGDLISAGHFCLNLKQWILITPKGEKKLTPKLGRLMEILMRHPGEVIERRRLIKEIWQTDYMGDTRTLDVHIRWIRQLVEDNPSKPQFIKTVRGKGYVLHLPH